MFFSRKLTSLKAKLAFFATLLVVFVALSLSSYIRSGEKRTIVNAQATSQLDSTRALAQVAREAMLVDDDTDMVNYVNLLRKSLVTAYAMVLYDDGRVRVHTDPTLIGKKLDDPTSLNAIGNKDRQKPLVQNIAADGKNIIDVSMPVYIGINPAEYKGSVRIGFDKNVIDQENAIQLRSVDRRIWEAFVFALLLGLVGALVLATVLTRPIRVLRDGAQRIGEGKLDHRIAVQTHDELQELADDFNAMAQKLGELDQMKQDFVSNVTHELRSPMTSIRGYIDLLLQGDAGPNTPLQNDYLSVVKNSAVRLGRFIDNLLDVAKIEAHKLKLTPEAVNIHTLAHEMGVLFKPQLDEKKLQFRNAVPATLAQAFADKDKIAETLINLTSNAIKFSSDNGTVEIQATEGPNYIEVSVHDTGAGIPVDMAEKLFSKFEQVKANQGLARKHKGTGLGLAIVKGVVEAHGGKIWIKSPAPSGAGTAFYFTIPKLTDEIKSKL